MEERDSCNLTTFKVELSGVKRTIPNVHLVLAV